MKALKFLTISIVSLIMVSLNLQAQNGTISGTATYKAITAILAGDTIRGTGEIGKSIYIDKATSYGFLYQASFDSLRDGGSALCILKGTLDFDTYYPLDTITWAIAHSDTTVIFNQISSAVIWRGLSVTIKGVGANTRAKLGPQHLKILPK
jgi:hypothetical protein